MTSPGAPEPSIVIDALPVPPPMKNAVGPYWAAAGLTSLELSPMVELAGKLKLITAAESLAVTAALMAAPRLPVPL